ncbi:hypothetical protein HPB47_019281 [Ixodes persulcatus]|uniref:Uncharacterized protein n=1 Tax=Ixodes persulcatus TaxID=34615 RepID=A0AC60QIK7_IXOPE|nr:hypothetical protein HPB47_019281 [Ixodes persulcatus]
MKMYRAKPSNHPSTMSWARAQKQDTVSGRFPRKERFLSRWCSRDAWKEKWISCRHLFSTSNIPGLRVIFQTSNLFRRLLWLAALAILGENLLWDTGSVVKEFVEYNDVVQIGAIDEGNQIALPAVTVCNLNPLRRSAFCDENFVSDVENTDLWYDKYCTENVTRIEGVLFASDTDIKDITKFTTWLGQLQKTNATDALRLGHQVEDMILLCNIKGQYSCSDFGNFTLRLNPRYGNCFCVGCDKEADQKLRVDAVVSPRAGGLQLLLNTELNEYLGVIPEAGFILMAHHPRVQPDITQDGIMLPLRSTTYISLRKPSGLVSNLGSIMSMYVGFSFLLVFNVVDVMARSMCAWGQRRGPAARIQ